MTLEKNPYDDPLNLQQQATNPHNEATAAFDMFKKMRGEISEMEAGDREGTEGKASPSKAAAPTPPLSSSGGPVHNSPDALVSEEAQKGQTGPPTVAAIYPESRRVLLFPSGDFLLDDRETQLIVDIVLGAFLRSSKERAIAIARAHGLTVTEVPPPASPAQPGRPPRKTKKARPMA